MTKAESTKIRDADDVARDGQCPLLAALAEPLDDEAVGDLFGGAGDLKQATHRDPGPMTMPMLPRWSQSPG